MPKHQRITKNKYLDYQIDKLLMEVYQNEVARDFLCLTSEDKRTDEDKKQINAANFNIEKLEKQIKWLEACHTGAKPAAV